MKPAGDNPRMTLYVPVVSATYSTPDTGPITTDVGKQIAALSGGPPSPVLPHVRVPIAVAIRPVARLMTRTM